MELEVGRFTENMLVAVLRTANFGFVEGADSGFFLTTALLLGPDITPTTGYDMYHISFLFRPPF